MTSPSSIDHMRWWNKWKNHPSLRVLLFTLAGVITFFLLLPNVLPDDLDVESGDIAQDDLRSPVTVENSEETERMQQEVLDNIDPVYAVQPRYTDNQLERIQDMFQTIHLVQLDIRQQEGDLTFFENTGPGGEEWSEEEQVQEVRERISEEFAEALDDDTIRTLLLADLEELQTAQDTITSAVHDIMSDEVALNEVDEARDQVELSVRGSSIRSSMEDAMADIAREGITANYMIDEEATQEAREAALDLVEPAMIREGQILAEEGQVVTAEIHEQLRLAGMTEESTAYGAYAGLALLTGLMMFVLAYYLGEAKTSLKTNNTHLLLFLIIYLLTLGMMKLASLLQELELTGIIYLVPAAFGAVMVSLLLHPRTAIFLSVLFAICASVLFNEQSASVFDFGFGIYVLFSSLAGVFFLDTSSRATRLLKTGAYISIMNMAALFAVLFMKGIPLNWTESFLYAGAASAAGFGSVVFALGLLPFFESGFGVLSSARLIELSNPNSRMLRKILLDTPGTYHHSVVVANLAEGACEAIGANGLLARVGSYYHDAGKTVRPQFFIENQHKDDNPHDHLPPKRSAEIIIAHPYDGAAMLRDEKMPKEIIDIAEQHHGTTLLKYFYFKAKETSNEVDERTYRYPGPKAQTREAAVVGIADSVEAAVRSMSEPTMAKIEDLCRKIIHDRLHDGQFDDCDITMRELDQVHQAICETLQGTFHTRIDYPDDEELKTAEGE
ncbi:HD family phosphohydrolase [Alkalicoccus chagannorensis]|uniref:HD family phosphohydrolase n=1 Tax=Alkalicoccus chagannorensis TaxID=427072 RepID=UPI0012EC83CF|nr:HD family phosphohydrolase [Alkalicoccus chagannorensis]